MVWTGINSQVAVNLPTKIGASMPYAISYALEYPSIKNTFIEAIKICSLRVVLKKPGFWGQDVPQEAQYILTFWELPHYVKISRSDLRKINS